ncbi:MAG: peptidase M14 [Planctomycetota bacterium]
MTALLLPPAAILACAPVGEGAGIELGRSREGRVLRGFVFGSGARRVSLIGGCHADEPVGPWLLRRLAAYLDHLPPAHPLLTQAHWTLVPHANPDGEARNRAWSEPEGAAPPLDAGFDPLLYLRHASRELPGDDIEFGFPRESGDVEARPENRAVAAFLRAHGPFELHASLHGMAYAGGPWFLLDEAWSARSEPFQAELRALTEALGYRLHDVQRHGEKGFVRIARGFCTRPNHLAMQAHFRARNDPEMAARFRPSSMEFVRALGGDALTLVSEMPLFTVEGLGDRIEPSDPAAERLRGTVLPRVQSLLLKDEPAARAALAEGGVRAMPIGEQMRLQLGMIEAGLRLVSAGS